MADMNKIREAFTDSNMSGSPVGRRFSKEELALIRQDTLDFCDTRGCTSRERMFCCGCPEQREWEARVKIPLREAGLLDVAKDYSEFMDGYNTLKESLSTVEKLYKTLSTRYGRENLCDMIGKDKVEYLAGMFGCAESPRDIVSSENLAQITLVGDSKYNLLCGARNGTDLYGNSNLSVTAPGMVECIRKIMLNAYAYDLISGLAGNINSLQRKLSDLDGYIDSELEVSAIVAYLHKLACEGGYFQLGLNEWLIHTSVFVKKFSEQLIREDIMSMDRVITLKEGLMKYSEGLVGTVSSIPIAAPLNIMLPLVILKASLHRRFTRREIYQMIFTDVLCKDTSIILNDNTFSLDSVSDKQFEEWKNSIRVVTWNVVSNDMLCVDLDELEESLSDELPFGYSREEISAVKYYLFTREENLKSIASLNTYSDWSNKVKKCLEDLSQFMVDIGTVDFDTIIEKKDEILSKHKLLCSVYRLDWVNLLCEIVPLAIIEGEFVYNFTRKEFYSLIFSNVLD